MAKSTKKAAVGDRVEILRRDIKVLEHRAGTWRGRVTAIDGAYVYVRPSWCTWSIELYQNEVRLDGQGRA